MKPWTDWSKRRDTVPNSSTPSPIAQREENNQHKYTCLVQTQTVSSTKSREDEGERTEHLTNWKEEIRKRGWARRSRDFTCSGGCGGVRGGSTWGSGSGERGGAAPARSMARSDKWRGELARLGCELDEKGEKDLLPPILTGTSRCGSHSARAERSWATSIPGPTDRWAPRAATSPARRCPAFACGVQTPSCRTPESC
jgi:hypothetical protein